MERIKEIQSVKQTCLPMEYSFMHPKYVAAVVAFLCSEDAAMMTGQDINVNAGAIRF
jgi:NAD(P)-dependent dehydrogenase (short-subunit alcohol dehydrogenase family)